MEWTLKKIANLAGYEWYVSKREWKCGIITNIGKTMVGQIKSG
jgi:hypothetical protein